jgi:hypothetical protein
MSNLFIEQTNYTPEIIFNVNGNLKFRGKSYPENTFEFYQPVKDWLKEYLEESTNGKTVIDFELTYLNSSSLKAYFDIFDTLEKIKDSGKDVEINWIYEYEDDIMEETGEDFMEDFENLKINMVVRD